MLMLNLILHACIQKAVHAGSLYVTTAISVLRPLGYCALQAALDDVTTLPLFSGETGSARRSLHHDSKLSDTGYFCHQFDSLIWYSYLPLKALAYNFINKPCSYFIDVQDYLACAWYCQDGKAINWMICQGSLFRLGIIKFHRTLSYDVLIKVRILKTAAALVPQVTHWYRG